ncbi:MBL fold metallo-hydrolase [Thermotoga sp. KOL6]|uniref:MBL fold metallo-hydrolase n=1 Tax=Thermotoga sp. KOL6 TaxID=126741 RepID=UPI000CC8A3A0|nr:MBL fold metallo-hydrolase [Thermotoga sp. KOL6]PLV59381.1 MBL fold metallo-hydrolase [Thermotoga sp. KOL6]
MITNLSDNVFVIGTGVTSNSVLVCGKKECILFDTTLFPEKAKKIKEFALEVLGKEIVAVFNTHYHPDHTFGNEIFQRIIAHTLTKDSLNKIDKEYMEKLGVEASIKLPTETFDDIQSYKFGEISVEAIHLGGHTPDSSIFILKKEKIVICGDLLTTGIHAEMVEDSNLSEWIEALERVEKISADYFVPGHGKVGTLDDVKKMKDYISKILRLRNGNILHSELLKDPNFSSREHPELLKWSLENIIR